MEPHRFDGIAIIDKVIATTRYFHQDNAMPDPITIYHNPRCSKSRAALEWLQQNQSDSELTVIEYLKDPLNRETVLEILDELQLQPEALVRRGEATYKELKLKDSSAGQLIDAIVENPILLERPIVRYAQQTAIGRPLDNVIELFD